MKPGSITITPLTDLVEICALYFGDLETLLSLKPSVPQLSDREWVLLAGRFGLRGAYAHCFVEYWKKEWRRGKTMEELFEEWLEISKADPSRAPLSEFVT